MKCLFKHVKIIFLEIKFKFNKRRDFKEGTLMKSIEERIECLEFYQELLLDITNTQYPLYDLIIKNQLTRAEYQGLLDLCEEISLIYSEQKAQGFIGYGPLLTHFAGMLNCKLDIGDTIDALNKQNIFPQLMTVLKKEYDKIRDQL